MTHIQSSILDWLVTSGLKILLIIIVSIIVYWLVKVAVKKIIKMVIAQGFEISNHLKEKQKRIETISAVVTKTGAIIIISAASIMILSELKVNITPLITGAGIVGLAIGFGSQALVKDSVTGLLILLENQYLEGEEIKINSYQGKVEEITLRKTTLRDSDGNLIFIPHGQIKTVINLSRKEEEDKIKI